MNNKLISIVTPCFNEEENVDELYTRIRKIMDTTNYQYQHMFIDNASTDTTAEKLRSIAAIDNRVKVIINTRNFGHIRSPYHAILQASGEAIICIASDLQDPPESITKFIEYWEKGSKVVIGVKTKSKESRLVYFMRTAYYRFLRKVSDIDLIEHFTGFGLYDREVIENLRKMDDPYPYFRGMIADLGYPITKIEFEQPRRERGLSKNNLYTLYDLAMLGITGYTKVPLRMATLLGFIASAASFIVGIVYLIYKLIFWSRFTLGSAPIIIGLFFLGSVQLLFLGIVGEYIGAIYTQVMKRPLVIEKERINF